MAIKIYKEEDDLLTPVNLIPMKELIDFNDPEQSEFRYIREYEITDAIQEAIEDTPFMEIAEEALSRSTAAKTMAEKATEDVTTAVIASEEAVEKVEALDTKVDGYDTRINNIDSKADAALQESQEAKFVANLADAVAGNARENANEALERVINTENKVSNVETDLNNTKNLLDTTRTNLGETINSLNSFKQDQHTIDESQNNTIAALQTEVNGKADKSELNNYVNWNQEQPYRDVQSNINNYFTNSIDSLKSNKADKSELNDKQDTLVSGTNIKTINGESILGSGNIEIQGGGGVTPEQLNEEISNRENADTNLQNQINEKQDKLISGNNLATINGYDLLAGGNIEIRGGEGGGDVYAAGDNTFTGINIFNNNLNALGGLTVTDPRDGYQDSVFNILLYGHNYSASTYYTISDLYAEGQKVAWDDEQGRYTVVNDGEYNIKHIYVYNNFNYVYQISNDFEAFWWNGNDYTEQGYPILKKIEYNVTPWYEYVVEVWVNVPVDFTEDVNLFYYFDSYNQSYLEAAQFIKDAPYDNQQYIRKDGSWQTIQIPESGVPEAPTDGNKYVRQDGEWVSLGASDDYITVPITNVNELIQAMNEYNSNSDGLSKRYYYLENDIDCGEQYLPGFGTNTNAGVYFGNKCVFDGRLHKISNFKIQGGDNTAFFNNVSDAEIMNLYLESFEITGGAFTAALIGVQQRSGGAKIHDISIVNGTVTGGAQNAAAISGLFMANNSVMQNIYVENVQVSGSLESAIITGWKNEATSIIRNIAIYNSVVSGTEYGRPLFRGNGSANFVYWNNPQGDTDYSGHSDINDTDIVDGTLVNNLNSNLEINDWVQGSQRPEFNQLILKDLPVSTTVTTDKENRFTENNYFAKDIYEGGEKLSDKYALKSEITPTTPNVVKFGDLSIENGIMSNFSASNYAQFPFLVDLTNKAFEIAMQITTGDNITTQQNILDSRDGLAFAIRNSQFVLAVSNNGTSWAFEANGGTVEANTTYLVKLSWNRLVYSVKYSTDNGTSWTEAINQPYSGSPYPRTMLIGKDTTGNYVFGGQINLNKCTLSVNNQYIWDGMADAGLLTRLETDLGNIDQAGVDKIKEIVAQDTIILTATLEDGSVKTFEIYGKEL